MGKWLWLRNKLVGLEADKGLLFRAFLYLLLVDVAFIYLKPVFYMMTTMVKGAPDLLDPAVIWVPTALYGGHLAEAIKMLDYAKSFGVSLTVSTASAVIQVVSCSIAGYAFARLDFPLKRFWFGALLFTFIMPAQVTILPSILLFKELGWINTFWPLLVPTLFGHGLKGALFVLIFRQFFSTLPKEMEEAARIDGAGAFRIFFRVMLPISRSAIVVVFLFSFVWSWNDAYFPSMYMFGASDVPLSVGLSKLNAQLVTEAQEGGLRAFLEPVKMGASFLIIMPLLVLYAFTQRWFVEGVERTGLVE
ncbi:ABC transporter permease [Cohnella sp. CIP 111063]|uniref:carbohydrate ABC transporter permease n=1 Tax=unclassified Cohnella TaxID=2636738 RepID=UPI000B8C619C|nr:MULTISPECIES: carbohydrate ABC transporter permease [unclassified Cohnella]OXS52825.1 ABC transporter permease [Cohnella sp. CIP 111063]PRX59797.1 multiple sugar transport system permease protein [Cohnella sp. SGD-V74]